VMGLAPDDLRIRDSFRLAEERGLQYQFHIDKTTEVAHPNTVGITLAGADGHSVHVTGVSIGGGSVRLRELDGVEIDLSGEYDTIVVKQYDKPGVVAFITRTLSESGVNIAFMRLYRENRGKIAYTIVEADQPIHRETVRTIFEHPDIVAARRITPREEADR
jgi:L-serine dehydratase